MEYILNMKTILYDVNTEKVIGTFSNGYTIDGQTPSLPGNLYELAVIENPRPEFDSALQYTTRVRVADLEAKEWKWEYTIHDKTEEQLQQEFESSVPRTVTKRQIMLALFIQKQVTESNINQMLSLIEDPTQKALAEIEWKNSSTVDISHPMVQQFSQMLDLSELDLKNLFIYANTL